MRSHDAQPLLRAVPARRAASTTGPTSASGTSCARACRETPRRMLVTGPSIEKSIAPLRSFVAEPMRFGRLFLAGDAAPHRPAHRRQGPQPRGQRRALSRRGADRAFYQRGRPTALDAYSARALARVWKAERFSWWMTRLLHQFPGGRATSGGACSSPSSTTSPAPAPRRPRSPRITSACPTDPTHRKNAAQHPGRIQDPSRHPRAGRRPRLRDHRAGQEPPSPPTPSSIVGMRQNPFPKKARKLLDAAGFAYTYMEFGSYFSGWKRRMRAEDVDRLADLPHDLRPRHPDRRRQRPQAPDRQRRAALDVLRRALEPGYALASGHGVRHPHHR